MKPSPDSLTPAEALADARRWLMLGTLALALAGIYSIPLFLGRSSVIRDSAFLQKLFDATLVVHVDLSIMVWFLSIAAMLWRLYRPEEQKALLRLPYFQRAAQAMFAGGIVLMAASPWFGGDHIKSDYIPVIGNGCFFVSLALLAAAVMAALVEALLAWNPVAVIGRAFSGDATLRESLRFGAWVSALIALAAAGCFLLSARHVDPLLVGRDYYEAVFWAGGHVLQFLYAQVMTLAWIVLAAASGIAMPGRKWICSCLFAVGLIAVPFGLLPFWQAPVGSDAFKLAYTRLMIEQNGTAPLLAAAFILLGCLFGKGRPAWMSAPFLALLASMLLFAAGGFIGHAIDGQNVTVPAHYHGSIVGVTLAFMGLAYVLLPRFGLADPSLWRLARIQPLVLCFGQLVFAGALAWSGGYDVMRKTLGLEGYPLKVKIAMGLVGGGGAIAVLGGILFVIVIWRARRIALQHKRQQNPA